MAMKLNSNGLWVIDTKPPGLEDPKSEASRAAEGQRPLNPGQPKTGSGAGFEGRVSAYNDFSHDLPAVQAATQSRVGRFGSPNAIPSQVANTTIGQTNEAGINTPIPQTLPKPDYARTVNVYGNTGANTASARAAMPLAGSDRRIADETGNRTAEFATKNQSTSPKELAALYGGYNNIPAHLRGGPSHDDRAALYKSNPAIFTAGTPENLAFIKAWKEGYHNGDAVALAQSLQTSNAAQQPVEPSPAPAPATAAPAAMSLPPLAVESLWPGSSATPASTSPAPAVQPVAAQSAATAPPQPAATPAAANDPFYGTFNAGTGWAAMKKDIGDAWRHSWLNPWADASEVPSPVASVQNSGPVDIGGVRIGDGTADNGGTLTAQPPAPYPWNPAPTPENAAIAENPSSVIPRFNAYDTVRPPLAARKKPLALLPA